MIMFQLRDFYHLPELEACLEQMIREPHGLMLVAGTAARSSIQSGAVDVALPSGRAAMMNMIFNEVLSAHPQMRAVMIGKDRTSMRPPRAFKARVRQVEVGGKNTFGTLLAAASAAQTGLIVVDQISNENIAPVMESVQKRHRVLSQIDTALRGEEVGLQLQELGAMMSQLEGLGWVITVQRLPALCPRCSQPNPPEPGSLSQLTSRFPHLANLIGSDHRRTFMAAAGCPQCKGVGRFGEVTVFDVYHPLPGIPMNDPACHLLTMEEYLLRLAIAGRLPLDEVLHFETHQRRRFYNLATLFSETVTTQTDHLQRRLVELETANRVLQQRTEQLISLESIGQALIATDDLRELGNKVCQRLDALCDADRVMLYYQHQRISGASHSDNSTLQGDTLEVLAVSGWDNGHIGLRVQFEAVSQVISSAEPRPHRGFPPGVEPGLRGVVADDRARLQVGLSLPLIANGVKTGLMLVQSTRKRAFLPGERALLQAFANQVALAIQRAGLMHERIQHEKLERELELARQLQQSMLPQSFPDVPGIEFAARSQPARWIGGDFYDVFALEDGQIALVIGDASDKGLPAALYMGLTRSLLRAEAHRSTSPEMILRSVNRLLLELGQLRGFISLCLALIDPVHCRVAYSRAGHERPLLLRNGTLIQLAGQGMILGTVPDTELLLDEMNLELLPGDRLVFFSDGLTDVLDEKETFFGEVRLQRLMQQVATNQVERLCNLVFERLHDYRGHAEQFDDMTLVVVAVAG
jgi:serine phosphatase RsbU (regulator of sigma subunit)